MRLPASPRRRARTRRPSRHRQSRFTGGLADHKFGSRRRAHHRRAGVLGDVDDGTRIGVEQGIIGLGNIRRRRCPLPAGAVADQPQQSTIPPTISTKLARCKHHKRPGKAGDERGERPFGRHSLARVAAVRVLSSGDDPPCSPATTTTIWAYGRYCPRSAPRDRGGPPPPARSPGGQASRRCGGPRRRPLSPAHGARRRCSGPRRRPW